MLLEKQQTKKLYGKTMIHLVEVLTLLY